MPPGYGVETDAAGYSLAQVESVDGLAPIRMKGERNAPFMLPGAGPNVPGLLMYRNAALSNVPQLVKAGVGRVYDWRVPNWDSGQNLYLQLYDAAAAAAVTVGTTVPAYSVPLADGGILENPPTQPFEFALGIVVAITTTPTGGLAPGVPLLCNLGYR